MDHGFAPRTLDAALDAMDAQHDASFESADIDPGEWEYLGRRCEGAFSTSQSKGRAYVPHARSTVPPHQVSSAKPATPVAYDGILLVGGPYRGMHVQESIEANGVYVIRGEVGEFVYRLYQRNHQRAIAVPFDATAVQIRDALFKQAGKHAHPRKATRPKSTPFGTKAPREE